MAFYAVHSSVEHLGEHMSNFYSVNTLCVEKMLHSECFKFVSQNLGKSETTRMESPSDHRSLALILIRDVCQILWFSTF